MRDGLGDGLMEDTLDGLFMTTRATAEVKRISPGKCCPLTTTQIFLLLKHTLQLLGMVIRIVLDEGDDYSHGGDKEPAIKSKGAQPEQLGCLRT